MLVSRSQQGVFVVVDYFGYVDLPEGVQPTSLEADKARLEVHLDARYYTRNRWYPYGDPYLVLCEINKSRKAGDKLTGDDLMGSTRQQYAADALLLLEPDDKAVGLASYVPTTLRIVKVGDGGHRADIPLLFDHLWSTFRAAGKAAPPAKKTLPGKPALNPLEGITDE